MSKKDKPGQDDEPSQTRQQEEAQESSRQSYFSRLRMGYNLLSAAVKSRQADRGALQATRPMKDMPTDPLSAGAGVQPGMPRYGVQDGVNSGVTDSDDGDGDGASDSDTGSGEAGGSTGRGGDGGGARFNPTLAPDAGYTSLGDQSGAEAKVDAKNQHKQDVQQEIAKAEGVKPKDDALANKGNDSSQLAKDKGGSGLKGAMTAATKGQGGPAASAPSAGAKGGSTPSPM